MLSVAYPQGFRVALPYAWPLALLALMAATALSNLRLVAAPGFEISLAPLFYLLAYRWFGVKAGLITAVLTSAPTIWWWGHPVGMILAIGNVLAVYRFAGQARSLSSVTFFYQATVGTLLGFAVIYAQFKTPFDVTLIIAMRRIVCETMLAATADLVALALVIDTTRRTVYRSRHVSLQQSLEALVSIAVAGAAALFMLGELNHVNDRLDLHHHDVRTAVGALPNSAQLEAGRMYRLRMHGVDKPLPLAITPVERLEATASALGCKRIDYGVSEPADRAAFSYWLHMCYVVPQGQGLLAVVSPQSHVVDLYGDTLRGALPLLAYLAVLQVGLFFFGRKLRRSSRTLNAALQGFGQAYLETRLTAPFREADELLETFTAANNEFVAIERQRTHLSRTVEELRSAIDLKLLSDIRFDSLKRELRFAKIDAALGRRSASLDVHAADIGKFDDLTDQNEIMVEFRRGHGPEDQWYLLLAREYDGETASWRYGCLIQLRTAKAFQTQMRHSARLMELGGMASALSHELRQPLFTISLAAQNAMLMVDREQPGADRLCAKFDRIIEQVERANAIVQRTSAYARLERDECLPTDLGLAVRNAVRFMRPVLSERSISIDVSVPPSVPVLPLPRIGIEQIVVNALQNAADSIDTRRDASVSGPIGRIDVTMAVADDAVTLQIRDDGAGLAPQVAGVAFNAFCTTKPEGKGTGLGLFVCRQIMDEVGGSIALADNSDESGATLTLRFPIAAKV
ncbi:ATP-binding protein [Blastomonas sp. AAP53]|uniref:sensor histidine kinase n=1 Tax=Blastomonas sp. AAP53 TaxID=1248760 RepID=UPI00031866EB|nr:ATP-binding protein [Blastomonas sp. AAP53]